MAQFWECPGMKLKANLDEIIAFSGCEKYIDTPVKRYSSGMTVRLGFAVAAHLEPEILVVDEVLAVGDAEFQKKAIGKMQDLSTGEGRTVLFVSHNMASVRKLCSRALLLKNGSLDLEGKVETIIENYLQTEQIGNEKFQFSKFGERKGSGIVRLKKVLVYGEKPETFPRSGKALNFEFYLENSHEYISSDIEFEFRIDDNIGHRLIWNTSKMADTNTNKPVKIIRAHMDRCVLNKGNYFVTVYIRVRNTEADWIQNAFSFEVKEGLYHSTGVQVPPTQSKILIDFKYSFND